MENVGKRGKGFNSHISMILLILKNILLLLYNNFPTCSQMVCTMNGFEWGFTFCLHLEDSVKDIIFSVGIHSWDQSGFRPELCRSENIFFPLHSIRYSLIVATNSSNVVVVALIATF